MISSVDSMFWIRIGSFLGFLSVAFGAFGAHALKSKLNAADFEIFQTACHYQVIHALALLAYGLFIKDIPARSLGSLPAWAFLVGILLFSGSLYVLVLSGQRWLGAITPLGGLSFLLGWAVFAWQTFPRLN